MFQKLPHHVAIIMDGNGRWAEERSRPRVYGHLRGSSRVRELIRTADAMKIKALTLFAFSSENWSRPSDEVSILMRLLLKWLHREKNEMMRKNIRFRAIGALTKLPNEIQSIISECAELSKANTGLQFTLALSYGGRQEIVETARVLAEKVRRGELQPEEISEDVFAKHVFDPELGDPDFLIRTSGERRLSNFLLWQTAYTEFHFTDTKWPDFSSREFIAALSDYAQRDRRFGNVVSKIKKSGTLFLNDEDKSRSNPPV